MGVIFFAPEIGVYPILNQKTTIGMKLQIDPANRDGGGGGDRGPVFLDVQRGPSRYELWRQLCATRDWVVFLTVVATVGWLVVGILVWMR